MENDIIVADKTFAKTIGRTVLKTLALGAVVAGGFALVNKALDKSDDKS